MGFFTDASHFVDPFIRHYGLLAIFVIIYLESFGAPVPGESAVIAASLFAASGELPIVGLAISVWAAAVLGDSTGYAIGRYGGRPVLARYGRFVGLTPDRLAHLEDMFRRRGPIIVIGARFVVLLRQLNGLVAGAMAMPWTHFFAANMLGAALWAALWTFGPYFLGDAFRNAWPKLF